MQSFLSLETNKKMNKTETVMGKKNQPQSNKKTLTKKQKNETK